MFRVMYGLRTVRGKDFDVTCIVIVLNNTKTNGKGGRAGKGGGTGNGGGGEAEPGGSALKNEKMMRYGARRCAARVGAERGEGWGASF